MPLSDINWGADPLLSNSATEPTPTVQPDYKAAALEWFHRGLQVIPIVPQQKRPALKRDTWLANLSESTIIAYWTAHPTHEVGCIVGSNMIVFDADAPEAVAALAEIEKAFDLTPLWVHKTRRGEHHFFGLSSDTFAKTNAHATAEHPERIDVKAGPSLVILPPSTGKSVELSEVAHVDELSVASQSSIDAVFRHNGVTEPRPLPEILSVQGDGAGDNIAQRDLAKLLDVLTPDLPHDPWLHVLFAVHWAYAGNQEGFNLIDRWSSGGKTYPGRIALFKRWQSFEARSKPITIGSVHKIAEDYGVDLSKIPGTNWEDFQPVLDEIDKPVTAPNPAQVPIFKRVPVFQDYSLTGYSGQLSKEVQEETYFLEPLALRGQATVWYAAPNAGKTLITLNRVISAIRKGLLQPQQVFYLNADDTSQGLLQKVRITESSGFNMLAPGHMGFDIKQLMSMLHQVCADGTAKDVVLIVDTLKKVTDLMDKQRASKFTEVIREFVSHGGTFLGLAHVNKKPGPSGKSVFAGTTDIRDDFDCAFVIDVIDNGRESGHRIVEFTNEKRRGTVADLVRFSYRCGSGISYSEILESVVLLDSVAASEGFGGVPDSDDEAISIVESSIRSGQSKKAELLRALQKHAGLSRRKADAVLQRYTGKESTLSRWNYEVREHGAYSYYLLARQVPDTDPIDSF